MRVTHLRDRQCLASVLCDVRATGKVLPKPVFSRTSGTKSPLLPPKTGGAVRRDGPETIGSPARDCAGPEQAFGSPFPTIIVRGGTVNQSKHAAGGSGSGCAFPKLTPPARFADRNPRLPAAGSSFPAFRVLSALAGRFRGLPARRRTDRLPARREWGTIRSRSC